MGKYERVVVYTILAALCWAVFGARLPGVDRPAFAGEPVADVVRAKHFVVVDDSGRVRARLEVEGNESSLDLINEEAKIGASLGVTKTGANLTFGHRNGNAMAALRFDEGEGASRLMLWDENGKSSARLEVYKREPALTLEDTNGASRAVLGTAQVVDRGTGEMEITAPSSLVLFDKEGKVFWRVPQK